MAADLLPGMPPQVGGDAQITEPPEIWWVRGVADVEARVQRESAATTADPPSDIAERIKEEWVVVLSSGGGTGGREAAASLPDVPFWELGPLEDCMRRRVRGVRNSKAPKKERAATSACRWRAICAVSDTQPGAAELMAHLKARHLEVLHTRTPISTLQLLSRLPPMFAPRLSAGIALAMHGLCPVLPLSLTTAYHASPHQHGEGVAEWSARAAASLHAVRHVVSLRLRLVEEGAEAEGLPCLGDWENCSPLPDDLSAGRLFAGCGYGRHGFNKAGLEWAKKPSQKAFTTAVPVLVWAGCDSGAEPPTPCGTPASGGRRVSIVRIPDITASGSSSSTEPPVEVQSLLSGLEGDAPVLLHCHEHRLHASSRFVRAALQERGVEACASAAARRRCVAEAVREYSAFLLRSGRFDETLLEGGAGSKFFVAFPAEEGEASGEGVTRHVTLEELVRPGGRMEQCIAGSGGLSEEGPLRPLMSEVVAGSRDAVLSPDVFVFAAVVSFFRSSGKICFIGASAPGGEPLEVQVVGRPVPSAHGTLLISGQLHVGDAVTIWGRLGVTAKGVPTVFATKVLLAAAVAPRFSTEGLGQAASFVAPLTKCPGVAVVPPPAGQAFATDAVIFSKPAGMTPVPFTGMKPQDFPTSLFEAAQHLSAIDDARRFFQTPYTKVFPSYLMLPRDASGLCIGALRSMECGGGSRVGADDARTTHRQLYLRFVAVCFDHTIKSKAEATTSATATPHIRILAGIPSMCCSLVEIVFSLHGTEQLPAVTQYCEPLPGATKAEVVGDGSLSTPLMLLDAAKLSAEYGVIGHVSAKEGKAKAGQQQQQQQGTAPPDGSSTGTPAKRFGPDPTVFGKFYGLRRHFLHLRRIDDAEGDASASTPPPHPAVPYTDASQPQGLPGDLMRVLRSFPGAVAPTDEGRLWDAEDCGAAFFHGLMSGVAPAGATSAEPNVFQRSSVFGAAVQASLASAVEAVDWGEPPQRAGAAAGDAGSETPLLLHDLAKKLCAHFERVSKSLPPSRFTSAGHNAARAALAKHRGEEAPSAATTRHPLRVSLPTLCTQLDRKRVGAYISEQRQQTPQTQQAQQGIAPPPEADDASPTTEEEEATWHALHLFLQGKRDLLKGYFGVCVEDDPPLPCVNPFQHRGGGGGACPCGVWLTLGSAPPALPRDAAADLGLHSSLPGVRDRMGVAATQLLCPTPRPAAPLPAAAATATATATAPPPGKSGVMVGAPSTHLSPTPPATGELLFCLGNASGRLRQLAATELLLLLSRRLRGSLPEGCVGGAGGAMELRSFRGVYRLEGAGAAAVDPTALDVPGGLPGLASLEDGAGLFATSLQCIARVFGVGGGALSQLRRAPWVSSGLPVRFLLTHGSGASQGKPDAEADAEDTGGEGEDDSQPAAQPSGGAFPFVVDTPPPAVLLRVAEAMAGGGGGGAPPSSSSSSTPAARQGSILTVVAGSSEVVGQGGGGAPEDGGLMLGSVVWEPPAAGGGGATVHARHSHFLKMWELKPFGFSGSMEGRVAALIMHVALMQAEESGFTGDTVVDACCGSGGLSSAAGYVFGHAVVASELRADFAQKAMPNFTHLGVSAVLWQQGSAPPPQASEEGGARVTLITHDASKPYPAWVSSRKVKLVVANPPWGVRFGSKSEALPILTNLTTSFPDALWCFIAPKDAVDVLVAHGVTVVRRFAFGCVQIVIAHRMR